MTKDAERISEQGKKALVEKLRTYFDEELDLKLGGFEAQFLLEFLEKELGAHYYNQGLYDAQVILSQKIDTLTDAIYELEKPVG